MTCASADNSSRDLQCKALHDRNQLFAEVSDIFLFSVWGAVEREEASEEVAAGGLGVGVRRK